MENEIKIEQKLGIHNRWDIEVIDSRTGEVKQTARGYNVICNRWWNLIFSSATSNYSSLRTRYISFGSGNGTPDVTDTALFHYEGKKEVGGASYNSTDNVDAAFARLSIQLGTGEYNGITISEVGFMGGYSGSVLTTHAVLKDMNGNPISVTKTEYDIINIYGTVYVHWDLDEYFETGICINLAQIYTSDGYGGSKSNPLLSYATGGRHLRRYSYDEWGWMESNILDFMILYQSGWKCLKTLDNSGRESWPDPRMSSSNVTSSFDAQNRTATYSMKFDVRYMNMARGIGCLALCSDKQSNRDPYNSDRCDGIMELYCRREYTNPWWPGSQITGEVVGTGDGTTKKFKTVYDFPYNATVKVNGVAVSNVTVKEMPSLASSSGDWKNYMMGVDTLRSSDGHIYPKSAINMTYNDNLLSPSMVENYAIYNPFYNEVGVKQFKSYYSENTNYGYEKIFASNDLVNWTLIKDTNVTSNPFNVPSEYQNYKYWKCEHVGGTSSGYRYYTITSWMMNPLVMFNMIYNVI